MERVIVYIDGFNLYYGLKEQGQKKLYWLDLQKLAINLLKPSQTLVRAKPLFESNTSPAESLRNRGTQAKQNGKALTWKLLRHYLIWIFFTGTILKKT